MIMMMMIISSSSVSVWICLRRIIVKLRDGLTTSRASLWMMMVVRCFVDVTFLLGRMMVTMVVESVWILLQKHLGKCFPEIFCDVMISRDRERKKE